MSRVRRLGSPTFETLRRRGNGFLERIRQRRGDVLLDVDGRSIARTDGETPVRRIDAASVRARRPDCEIPRERLVGTKRHDTSRRGGRP